MTFVERSSENLARHIDRRRFLDAGAKTIFGLVTAIAVGARAPRAWATHGSRCPDNGQPCSCQPPYNRYCTQWNSSYCAGSACQSPCSYSGDFGYPNDFCWCTASCTYAPGTGYYKCCDCSCPEGACGCRAFFWTSGGPQAPVP